MTWATSQRSSSKESGIYIYTHTYVYTRAHDTRRLNFLPFRIKRHLSFRCGRSSPTPCRYSIPVTYTHMCVYLVWHYVYIHKQVWFVLFSNSHQGHGSEILSFSLSLSLSLPLDLQVCTRIQAAATAAWRWRQAHGRQAAATSIWGIKSVKSGGSAHSLGTLFLLPSRMHIKPSSICMYALTSCIYTHMHTWAQKYTANHMHAWAQDYTGNLCSLSMFTPARKLSSVDSHRRIMSVCLFEVWYRSTPHAGTVLFAFDELWEWISIMMNIIRMNLMYVCYLCEWWIKKETCGYQWRYNKTNFIIPEVACNHNICTHTQTHTHTHRHTRTVTCLYVCMYMLFTY